MVRGVFTVSASVSISWKHPHGRGEDDETLTGILGSLETPPRTWGRRPRSATMSEALRNTPTDVGKTARCAAVSPARKKHPHGRGEDTRTVSRVTQPSETPPRTWGRRSSTMNELSSIRNTPTDVGKTPHDDRRCARARKHPHGRGEDQTHAAAVARQRETPPRTWGRHSVSMAANLPPRNTPTDVGKTCDTSVYRWR